MAEFFGATGRCRAGAQIGAEGNIRNCQPSFVWSSIWAGRHAARHGLADVGTPADDYVAGAPPPRFLWTHMPAAPFLNFGIMSVVPTTAAAR